jgi:capsular polysaccharide transport system permease protein
MLGIVRPAGASSHDAQLSAKGRWVAVLYAYRWFIALVLLPTLIVGGYYYLVTSDQYESKAVFVVRRAGGGLAGGGGVGQLLGFSFGASESQSEARIVEEYLLSQDSVARLRREDGLVQRFRLPGIDVLSRLWDADPAPEDLLKYYRKQVTVESDPDKGLSTLSVKAFRPEDAAQLANKLLRMGEEQVNAINQRTTADSVKTSAMDLAAAEHDMSDLQHQLTAFRRQKQDIDPAETGKAQIGLVSSLAANLAAAKAKLHAAEGFISHDSPQYRALLSQVRSLEGQVAAESGRLTGPATSGAIANNLGGYEELTVRQEFAGKRYLAAAGAYQQALAEARKQQLYLIRVVQPNTPVKSLFPERGRIVLTLFCSLLIAYAIGWLMVAGVKEHNNAS